MVSGHRVAESPIFPLASLFMQHRESNKVLCDKVRERERESVLWLVVSRYTHHTVGLSSHQSAFPRRSGPLLTCAWALRVVTISPVVSRAGTWRHFLARFRCFLFFFDANLPLLASSCCLMVWVSPVEHWHRNLAFCAFCSAAVFCVLFCSFDLLFFANPWSWCGCIGLCLLFGSCNDCWTLVFWWFSRTDLPLVGVF